MNTRKNAAIILLVSCFLTVEVKAQEESEPTPSAQVLTQAGYDKTAPAVVKLVSDEGRRIGAGVIIGVHEDDVGFILTAYSMVAGRDKLAVILKEYPEPLLGHIVERWIDFDSDLAVVAVKDFPPDQPVIAFRKKKADPSDDIFSIIVHDDDGDWKPVPIELSESDESHVAISASEFTGIEGAPIVDDRGNMLALIVTEGLLDTEDSLTLAIKTNTIRPIVKEWFKPIALKKKWREQGLGFGGWIWAIGGSVLGGTVATAIAIAGGGEQSPRGLPRPPNPPQKP